MPRISMGLSLLSLFVCGILSVSVSGQDNTAALKAKVLAKEKLAPSANVAPKAKAKTPAAPAKAKSKPRTPPKPKTLQQQADDLQRKSSAMSSLTEYLTDRRTKNRKRVEMMTAYLKSIDKLQEYEKAKTPAPSSKAELTFRHVVNVAIKRAAAQGNTNVSHPDASEVALLRRIYSANNRLAKKTWNEYAALRSQVRSMGAYLDSIGKADEYKKWAGVEADQQKQAFEKKMQDDRAKEVAAYKTKRAKEQQQQQQQAREITAQQRQDRQQDLQRRFELRQQQQYNRMRENTASPGWCGWGDSYNDVYCPPQN